MTTTLVQYAYEIKPLEYGKGGLFESLYDPQLEAFMKIPAHAVVCSPYWPQSPPLAIVPHVSHHIAANAAAQSDPPPRYPAQYQDPGKVVVQYQQVPSPSLPPPPASRAAAAGAAPHHTYAHPPPAPGRSGSAFSFDAAAAATPMGARAPASFPHPRPLGSLPQAPSQGGSGSIATSRARRSTRKRSSRSPDAAYDYSDEHFFDFSDSDSDGDAAMSTPTRTPTRPPAKKRRRRGSGVVGGGGRKSRSSSVSRAPRRSVRLHVEPGTGDDSEPVSTAGMTPRSDNSMSPTNSSKLSKTKHRKHYRYTHKRVCDPKEISKHKWVFIEDHARVLEIMNRIFTGFKSDYGANWCRYCGAKTASSYSKSPWGPSKLCTKHYVDGMQKDTLNLANHDEPTDPERPINADANCEIYYMNRMIRTYGVGAGVLTRTGEVIDL